MYMFNSLVDVCPIHVTGVRFHKQNIRETMKRIPATTPLVIDHLKQLEAHGKI